MSARISAILRRARLNSVGGEENTVNSAHGGTKGRGDVALIFLSVPLYNLLSFFARRKPTAFEFSGDLRIQVILREDILAMVLNSKTCRHSTRVAERRCVLSGGSLRVNGEERRGMQLRPGDGREGGRERDRRGREGEATRSCSTSPSL